MSKDLNKTAAFNILKEHNASLSLSELLNALGPGYADRTVRRWLTEWASNGLVQKIGKKRGARYLAVGQDIIEPAAIYFSKASQNIISRIKAPYGLRKSVTYQPKWLHSYRPNIDLYFSSAQRSALTQTGSRAQKYRTAGTYARHIYNRLLIDLSYNSSRLEGNTYSLLETEKLIVEGTPSPGKPDEEKTMILNHKEAIRFLVDRCEQPQIDHTAVCSLHYLLSDGLVAPEYAGKVRDYGVRIGGSTYIPLENPTVLNKHLNDICDKFNAIENPFEKSIFLLAHVAYLQPFVDVNKRTSRLLANYPLFHANLVPLSFDAVEQSDYINAMIAIYELNNIKPLVDLYLHSYQYTAEKYDATIEAISFDWVRVQYRQQRREIIRFIITNKLHGKEMNQLIESSSDKIENRDDRRQFIRNIHEDLEQLGPQSIAGLGITINQVEDWKKVKKNHDS